MDLIYLDHHATTPMRPDVWEAIRPFMTETFGNPSSAHSIGRKARQSLEDARESIAAQLHAHADEIIFTSGATEANNLAILGLTSDSKSHLIGSMIEHPCVVEPLRQLASRGHPLDWLPVPSDGVIRLDDILAYLRPTTRLLTLMAVNHEMAAVQAIADVGRHLPSTVRLHCDAAQAAGKFAIDFHGWGCASLTISGHKFGGPKGIGALVLRRGLTLKPQSWGGHQQAGRRPGTEPVALAVGMAVALAASANERERNLRQVNTLRSRLVDELRLIGGVVSGPEQVCTAQLEARTVSPYGLNVAFPDCAADMLLMKLDLAGIACSTGSACASGSLRPSPVLEAMGLPDSLLRSSIRLSLSASQDIDTIDEAIRRISFAVQSLRHADDEV